MFSEAKGFTEFKAARSVGMALVSQAKCILVELGLLENVSRSFDIKSGSIKEKKTQSLDRKHATEKRSGEKINSAREVVERQWYSRALSQASIRFPHCQQCPENLRRRFMQAAETNALLGVS